MTGKHTPGPWRISYERGTKQIRAADNESLMGDETYYPWVPENPEDWHLISAAPDLLKALADAVDAWETHRESGDMMQGDWVREARAAIAKAQGQA